jgi:hypothetical protein
MLPQQATDRPASDNPATTFICNDNRSLAIISRGNSKIMG